MNRKKDKTIYFKTDEEIEMMRHSCKLVSKTLGFVASMLREGITGAEIDKAAEAYIRDHKAIPSFKGLYGCPSSLLISKNSAVVHGIPDKNPFKIGDILSIDCGTTLNGWVGDCAYTFVIGQTTPEALRLLRTTNEALYLGIAQAHTGMRVGDISFAVQRHCESKKYGVVRDLVGHGVGRSLHEAPEVPNYGKKGNGPLLKNGMTIAIEPMVNMGTREVRQAKDKWTIVTLDGKPSAHYEHTVAVRPQKAEILTTHQYIEESVKKNSELFDITEKMTTFAA
jgi:methionyl aminopeptidase